ncbi:hypothetical protein [Citrobacter koseri]|uniref:hypothetical protein n=1 Tax=Citrobacter koseri TaxID=545 RepID=UPI0015F06FCC|nr:hypothetical protein [Citrobacter koseri]
MALTLLFIACIPASSAVALFRFQAMSEIPSLRQCPDRAAMENKGGGQIIWSLREKI